MPPDPDKDTKKRIKELTKEIEKRLRDAGGIESNIPPRVLDEYWALVGELRTLVKEIESGVTRASSVD